MQRAVFFTHKNSKQTLRRYLLKSQPRLYTRQYSKANDEEYKQIVDECFTNKHRLMNLLIRNQHCQFTSFTVDMTKDMNSNVKSTNVPYVSIPTSHARTYFNKNEPSQKETTDPPKAKKSQSVQQAEPSLEGQAAKEKPKAKLAHYEIVYCMMDNSPHVQNLSSNNFEEMFNTKLISMTVGAADTQYNDSFLQAGLLPPRGVICGDVKEIEKESEAFSSIWKEYFRPHSNISHQLKMNQVRMFRLNEIRSAFFTDLSNKMQPVESIAEFAKMQADPIATNRKLIQKLNMQGPLIDKITSKLYGLKLGPSKIVFDIDKCGIRLIAKPMEYKVGQNKMMESDQWQEYYLDFGYAISDEAQLNQFFLQTQSVL